MAERTVRMRELLTVVLTGFIFTAGVSAQTPVSLLDGKLLEFVFSSNLTANPKPKAALDRIADPVKLVPGK